MNETLVHDVHEFLVKNFYPRFGELTFEFSDSPLWGKLSEHGTELWLDTANLQNMTELWTKDFTTVTTNTTLLSHEMQQGTWDALIKSAYRILSRGEVPEREMVQEMGFIMKAAHALKVVEKFDAFVSVEAHMDGAYDPDSLTDFGRRFHAVCPERFIVSVPFTSAGIIASRRLSGMGIPVNLTLGFSARQNYIAARLGKPQFVGLFTGRIGSFVRENGLGSGESVGEKTAFASQQVIRELRASGAVPTRQIASSLRNVKQVVRLAGIDILTLPPAVADSYRKLAPDQSMLGRQGELPMGLDAGAAERFRFDTLWNVPDKLIETVIAIEEKHDVGSLTVAEFEAWFDDRSDADLFPCWTPEQVRTSSDEGKLPALAAWKYNLDERIVGIDSLLSFAGLNGFRRDQKSMDARITGLIKELAQP